MLDSRLRTILVNNASTFHMQGTVEHSSPFTRSRTVFSGYATLSCSCRACALVVRYFSHLLRFHPARHFAVDNKHRWDWTTLLAISTVFLSAAALVSALRQNVWVFAVPTAGLVLRRRPTPHNANLTRQTVLGSVAWAAGTRGCCCGTHVPRRGARELTLRFILNP